MPEAYEDAIKHCDGWLSPQGQFYRSQPFAHYQLAALLCDAEPTLLEPDVPDPMIVLEKAGWAKLSGIWHVSHIRKITKRQRDFIMSWCAENDKKEPEGLYG